MLASPGPDERRRERRALSPPDAQPPPRVKSGHSAFLPHPDAHEKVECLFQPTEVTSRQRYPHPSRLRSTLPQWWSKFDGKGLGPPVAKAHRLVPAVEIVAV